MKAVISRTLGSRTAVLMLGWLRFLVQVAKRVEGRLSVEAKEEQKRAFEALEEGEEQAPPPKLKKISTTQVALNYVR